MLLLLLLVLLLLVVVLLVLPIPLPLLPLTPLLHPLPHTQGDLNLPLFFAFALAATAVGINVVKGLARRFGGLFSSRVLGGEPFNDPLKAKKNMLKFCDQW